jgi:hypothetical protein
MLTSLQGGDDARERGVLQFTTAWTFFSSPSAETFQWINNFGLKVQGIEVHTYERQFIQVCDESGKVLALSRRRHWTAKGLFIYVRRWKRRNKTKWTLPIFNLLHQRETLKRLNSSNEVGTGSSKWISMLKSHQFGPWITWKDSRYSIANEKGISQSRARDFCFFPICTFTYRASYSGRSGSSLAIQGSAFAYV